MTTALTTTLAAPRCIRCGCTEDRACPVHVAGMPSSCVWVMVDRRRRVGLCSACATATELVFTFLPPARNADGSADLGVTAALLADFLTLPASTVRRALQLLELRGLATPVDKAGNERYWCSPAIDETMELEQ